MAIPSIARFRLWRLTPSRTWVVSKLANKLRRWALCALDPAYIRRQQELREGECVRCGRCCRLVFRCPFLGGTEDNPLCLIYEKGRPFQCAAFPIDPRDLADVDFQCGYSFAAADEGVAGRRPPPPRPREAEQFPYPVYRA
ncbi:MAG: hypothetical protein AB1515_00125 [Nitrospirota bacterium]